MSTRGFMLHLAAIVISARLAFPADRSASAAPDPASVRGLLNTGFELVESGDPAQAVTIFRQVLALDVGNRHAKYGISAAYIKLERYKESIAILDSLIEQFPDDYVLKNNAAWLFATARDPKYRDLRKAVDLAREALLIRPSDFHIWSTLAEAYYRDGDYENALRSALEAERLAKLQQARPANESVYTEQVKKCRAAVEAFTLVE